MKKIFWTSVVWIGIVVLFWMYMRLFDSGIAQYVANFFASSATVSITGEVQTAPQAQTISDALDSLSAQIDIAASKIAERQQQKIQAIVPEVQASINVGSLTTSTTTIVKLYYFNEKEDKLLPVGQQANPQSLSPVFRTLPASDNIIQDTISLLLQGALTDDEFKNGITSSFIKAIRLMNVSLATDGTLSLTFEKAPTASIGRSAFIGILTNALTKTALQFPQVKSVNLLPVELFQP